jgi:hypothetical protein
VKKNNIPAKLTPDVIDAVNKELEADFGMTLDLLPEPEGDAEMAVCYILSNRISGWYRLTGCAR